MKLKEFINAHLAQMNQRAFVRDFERWRVETHGHWHLDDALQLIADNDDVRKRFLSLSHEWRHSVLLLVAAGIHGGLLHGE